jgi:hypothetical protein
MNFKKLDKKKLFIKIVVVLAAVGLILTTFLPFLSVIL